LVTAVHRHSRGSTGDRRSPRHGCAGDRLPGRSPTERSSPASTGVKLRACRRDSIGGPLLSVSGGRSTAMWQQLANAGVGMREQPLQDVPEVGPRVMPMELGRLHQTRHHRRALAGKLAAGERHLPQERTYRTCRDLRTSVRRPSTALWPRSDLACASARTRSSRFSTGTHASARARPVCVDGADRQPYGHCANAGFPDAGSPVPSG